MHEALLASLVVNVPFVHTERVVQHVLIVFLNLFQVRNVVVIFDLGPELAFHSFSCAVTDFVFMPNAGPVRWKSRGRVSLEVAEDVFLQIHKTLHPLVAFLFLFVFAFTVGRVFRVLFVPLLLSDFLKISLCNTN